MAQFILGQLPSPYITQPKTKIAAATPSQTKTSSKMLFPEKVVGRKPIQVMSVLSIRVTITPGWRKRTTLDQNSLASQLRTVESIG